MTNFVTKEHAADLKCPLMVVSRGWGHGNCAGPKCAMWRWRIPQEGETFFEAAVERETKLADVDRFSAVQRIAADPLGYTQPEFGYCGMAGTPNI